MLPAALQLRKDDAELDAQLDREAAEKQVREQLEDFNRRVVEARRQLQGGPPVVTPTRDVEAEVAALARAPARCVGRRRPTPSRRSRGVGGSADAESVGRGNETQASRN